MERRHLAAASGHLHLAAAAYYMAKAAGHAPGRAEAGSSSIVIDVGGDGKNSGDDGAAASPTASTSIDGDDDSIVSIDVGSDDDDGSAGSAHVDDGSGSGSGGDDGSGEEELQWSMQDLYDLLLLLASFVPPAPAYKALPRDVVEGLAWTWILLVVYGVFITVFSVRVLGTSSRCLPTFLRALLLTATILTEAIAAVYMMPATVLTVVGACFIVLLLLAAHLIICRRRRRRR